MISPHPSCIFHKNKQYLGENHIPHHPTCVRLFNNDPPDSHTPCIVIRTLALLQTAEVVQLCTLNKCIRQTTTGFACRLHAHFADSIAGKVAFHLLICAGGKTFCLAKSFKLFA